MHDACAAAGGPIPAKLGQWHLFKQVIIPAYINYTYLNQSLKLACLLIRRKTSRYEEKRGNCHCLIAQDYGIHVIFLLYAVHDLIRVQ